MFLVLLKVTCTLLAGFLCGSTLYSSLVEIPVRQQLSEEEQMKNWKLVFEKAHKLSKTSGLITCVLTLVVWYITSNVLWLACSLILFLILPYTVLLLAKTNEVLLHSKSTIGLSKYIKQWDRLHHGRTAICFVGFLIYLVAIAS
ncbi:MAG: DUF1772 domain-containing protein [Reichenbachiella sp.]|uniref:DUF1772 domain-containing protein n=1 Tax=Reichenbachiella sp. TaxID=2184521 RepID=UPI003263F1BD